MTSSDSANNPILILDFDGTLCVGEGPVRAYAQAVAALLSEEQAATLISELSAYTAGRRPHSDFGDAYELVHGLGAGLLSPEQRQACYHESRRWLARHPDQVHAPDGLAEFLASLNDVLTILVTNSPTESARSALDGLGLAEVIDEVQGSANKPHGFDQRLSTLLDGRDPRRLMSVGDLWANDIQPALHAGCLGAWINPYGLAPRPAQLSAPDFPSMYSSIAEWAAGPEAFADSHPLLP